MSTTTAARRTYLAAAWNVDQARLRGIAKAIETTTSEIHAAAEAPSFDRQKWLNLTRRSVRLRTLSEKASRTAMSR